MAEAGVSAPATYDMTEPDGRRRGVAAAAAVLTEGRLVGLPTETVYGLAADATNAAAVAAIFAAKGRPRFNPLIVHVPDGAAAEAVAILDARAQRLAAAFWPGPLTLVLPRRVGAGIADLATAGLATIAVRVPAHPVAQAVLAAFARPLAAPSANRSGHVSPTTAAHVAADLGASVAVLLDAGPAMVGVESTIVALGDGRAMLLRAGGIERAAIEGVLGESLDDPGTGDPERPAAPGMLASHYAPAVPLRLEAEDVRPGESLLGFGLPLPPGHAAAVATVNLSPGGNVREAATRLFAALRTLEAAGAPIAAMPVPKTGLGAAINDRLRRAAAPRDPTIAG